MRRTRPHAEEAAKPPSRSMRPARFLGIMVRCPPSPFETLTRPSLRLAGLAPQDEGDGERGGCSAKLKAHMSDGAYLYILRCADDSYYTGTARSGLEQRVAEHNAGTYGGYTAQRRPVTLVFSQWFDRITDAIAAERQVKGWSRAKKEALI